MGIKLPDEATPISIENLIKYTEDGWNEFQSYLNTLTDEQMTKPTDAAGWTVKDHVAHLMVWEEGIYKLLIEKTPRHAGMGITEDAWMGGDVDVMNEQIRQQYINMPLHEVKARFQQVHDRMMAHLKSLSTEDILRPYSDFVPGAENAPVMGRILGNGIGHYDEHMPWIEAIVQQV